MSAFDDHLKQHRRRIIDREEQTIREMISAYDDIERDLRWAFRELARKIRDAEAAGETISPSWFYRRQRLRTLIDSVREQIVRFGGRVTPIIAREQQAAAAIAADHTASTISMITGDKTAIGAMLNPRHVEVGVGLLGNGSPIRAYWEEKLAPGVAEKMEAEIIKAATLGTDFKNLARKLEETGDITRSRALATARTEVGRIRREAARQVMIENDGTVSGWEWVASHSVRTCVVCLAQDGKVYALTEPFPPHPNCRCEIIPVIIDSPRKRKLGTEWFDEQPDDVKEAILGPEAFAAYQRGEVDLKDFVGWKTDKRFGRSVYRRPLIQAISEHR